MGEEQILWSNSQPNEGSFNSDLVVWNAMIKGYAMNGQGDRAVSFYHQILLSGKKPNHIIFLVVLYACNHAGLVNEGHKYFDSIGYIMALGQG